MQGLALPVPQTSRYDRMGQNRGYPQKPENRPKWFKNKGFLGFKAGFELPRPNAVEPWCRFADLSIFWDRDFWGPRHGQIPINIQAFPSVGRPVMPSRRQLGPRGSVWRWLEASRCPQARNPFMFWEEGKQSIILPYAIVCMSRAQGPWFLLVVFQPRFPLVHGLMSRWTRG